jgi:uncharacterized protein (TIGR02677 family)
VTQATSSGFGLDAFGLDDRMRLFGYVTADNRHTYRWLLRAIETARAGYQTVLATDDIAAALAALRAADPDCPDPDDVELPRLLDALHDWGVLERGQDSTRARTLAEYRNRHSVYQFTEAGWRAHRAVESVLNATMAETSLSRLVFKDLLADLEELAAASTAGDSEKVWLRLDRIDRALADVAERAARFYTMIGDLSRTQEAGPEVFMQHKDALLNHLRDFHTELQRYSPLLAAAVRDVEATGTERVIALAAESDEQLFATHAERLAHWERRWNGLKSWLCPPSADHRSEADRLAAATVSAIGDVTAMLRRITEANRGGVSRESQLRHLAAWFTATPSETAAHALYDVVFALGGTRHAGAPYPDPEAIPTRRSWWDAEAVPLARSFIETGREPGSRNTKGPKVRRDTAERARLRERQIAEAAEARRAAATLAEHEHSRDETLVLDETQFRVLLRLFDAALASRGGPLRHPVTARSDGVVLRLEPDEGTQLVRTKNGSLLLDRMRFTVTGGTP